MLATLRLMSSATALCSSAALAIWGANRGDYFGFSSVPALWLCSILLAVALYPAVNWFAGFKARRRDIAWLKYF